MASFQDIQNIVLENAKQYSKDYNIEYDTNFCIIKLMEEVGELSEALLTSMHKSRPEKYVSEEVSQQCVASELSDVFAMTIICAHAMGVDLQAELLKKWK